MLLPVAIGADIGAILGGIRGANSNMGFWNGAIKGALVGAVGGGLSMFGGGAFLANVAWGIADGAATGGLDAAVWGTNIRNGIISGAIAGGLFATAQSGYESVKNAIDGYGFGTNDGVFNSMVKDAVSNSTVDAGKAQDALDFWQQRFGGPTLTYAGTGASPSTSVTGQITITGPSFIAGSSTVRRSIAHETGHYINNLNWDNKEVGSTISNPKFINLDRSFYGGDGIYGYRNAIINAGKYHVSLSAISIGSSNGLTSPFVKPAWEDFNFTKWFDLIPRRF